MTAKQKDVKVATLSSILTAVAIIAGQIAGKAARDGIFLSTYDITDLPVMLIAASVMSILMVLCSSRLMVKLSPARLVPMCLALSAALFLAVWGLTFVSPKIGAVLLYLHVTGFGVVLISGFWSMVNERFDPHTAKKTISRIVAGATFGGLLGGILAERIAASAEATIILPIIAGLHLLCAWKIRDLAPHSLKTKTPDVPKESRRTSFQVLKQESYLRNLAIIVMLGTVSAAMLDYVYKFYATEKFGNAENLMRFFAWYYMGVGLLTFLVQTALSRRSLEKLGLAATIACLPFATAAGSVGALIVPNLIAATGARLSEAVLRSSLFRSGYELFFVPVPTGEKRATKTIIDVGFDRLGDGVGGGLIKLVLFAVPLIAIRSLLVIALVLSGLALTISMFLKRGYVKALEKSLIQRGVSEPLRDAGDSTTDSIILRTLTNLSVHELSRFDLEALPDSRKYSATRAPASAPAAQTVSDPVARKVIDLRSGNIEKVKRVLDDPAGVDPVLTPHLLLLLAWDEVYPDVVEALNRNVSRTIGQLIDAMLDIDEEFVIRRRIPLVLSTSTSQRAVDGLFMGLHDKRFEVRFKCAKALNCIQAAEPQIAMDDSKIYEVVLTELKEEKQVWYDRRILDKPGHGCEFNFYDQFIKDRGEYSLEHVFTLLSLALERKPLQVAYRGLHTADEMLRGTALEYLDVILPPKVRDAMWPKLGDHKPRDQAARDRAKATQNLLLSSQMIDSQLAAALKKQAEEEKGKKS